MKWLLVGRLECAMAAEGRLECAMGAGGRLCNGCWRKARAQNSCCWKKARCKSEMGAGRKLKERLLKKNNNNKN